MGHESTTTLGLTSEPTAERKGREPRSLCGEHVLTRWGNSPVTVLLRANWRESPDPRSSQLRHQNRLVGSCHSARWPRSQSVPFGRLSKFSGDAAGPENQRLRQPPPAEGPQAHVHRSRTHGSQMGSPDSDCVSTSTESGPRGPVEGTSGRCLPLPGSTSL